jgi:hypothetical protein
MTDVKRPERVLPDEPEFQPLERFWPYAELSEQPSDEELARLSPELAQALFGAKPLAFSISLVFPAFDGDLYPRALELARASDEYQQTVTDGVTRHRARFYPGDRPERLRDLYDLIAGVPDSDVLVDDRPVPYARELWLPLVWCLIR